MEWVEIGIDVRGWNILVRKMRPGCRALDQLNPVKKEGLRMQKRPLLEYCGLSGVILSRTPSRPGLRSLRRGYVPTET